MATLKPEPDRARLDRIVAEARRAREERERGYRARALALLPWVCVRCARSFDRATVHLLTVHHRDHNHDHNPVDGSNWELLCVYCHENEHARVVDNAGRTVTPGDGATASGATWRPFADLEALMKRKK